MRRALIAAGLLVLVMVVAVIIWYLSGGAGALFRWRVTPRTPFAETPAPPAPNYADERSWAALPERSDEADVVPTGVSMGDQRTMPADVFFIHPTSFMDNDHWNQPIDDEMTNRRTDTLIMRNQASAFNGCCRVYAPRYRQATLGAFFQQDKEAYTAPLELAYGDVQRAFSFFIEHFNDGRPFIIASHSQGAIYAPWLLDDMVDGTALEERFVAAYIVGYALPMDLLDGQLERIGPCETADDTGCVVAWNTVGADLEGDAEDAEKALSPVGHRFGDRWERIGSRPVLCTNPLTWTTDETPTDPSRNLGGWVMRQDAPRDVVPAPTPHLTGARCQFGFLVIDPEPPEFVRESGLPARDHNYHLFDYQLFYMNIRENARARVAAFLR
jgi:hypothetical protein